MAEQVGLSSRRGLLAAGVAAFAALAAQAFGRPLRVRAADDEPVLVGGEYTSDSVTKIDNGTTGSVAIEGISSGGGTGVIGFASAGGTGLIGHAGADGDRPSPLANVGIQGRSAIGVYGESDNASGEGVVGFNTAGRAISGVSNSSTQPAIIGISRDNNRTGVLGYSGPAGGIPAAQSKTGVHGEANQDSTAVGVRANSQPGWGLHATTNTGAAVRADALANNGVAVDAAGIGPSPVIRALSLGAAPAVEARGTNSFAPAALIGQGYGSPGVVGVSAQSSAGPALSQWTGVYGYAPEGGTAARGVRGDATAGRGVHGQATTGVGVYAAATAASGTAFRAVGQVRFSTAGLSTIARGTRSRTITPGVDITSSSKVFVTLQSSPGGATSVQRVSRDAVNNRFTVYLTANATATTTFAWFVIS